MHRAVAARGRRLLAAVAEQQRRNKTRRVYLCSSNEHKLAEFREQLERYGIEVCVAKPPPGHKRWDDAPDEELRPYMQKLLEEADDKYWVKSLMREHTSLHVNHPDATPVDWEQGLVDCQRMFVRSKLDVWQLPTSEQRRFRELARGALMHVGDEARETADEGAEGGKAEVAQYETQAEGYVDTAKQVQCPGVFGWDSVFVSRSTSLSFHEKKGLGCKVSPRNMNIDRWIAENIHYKKRKSMRWSKFDRDRTIVFGERSTVRDFVATNEYLNNEVAKRTGLTSFFHSVVNCGVFFRAGTTRREMNYWLPGLNAGIPMTAKRDAVHEICFTAHDFGHFLIPDLVFSGEDTPTLRRVYIIARMLSEAVTMILADMVFVESLRQSGVRYDWKKRRIHPLLEETGIEPLTADGVDVPAVRRLLRANVLYCLMGDDSGWCELAAEGAAKRGLSEDEVAARRRGDFEAITEFKDKYMPFFVEDYRWTARNWDSMSSRKEVFARWWPSVEPIARAGLGDLPEGMGLETVGQFAGAIGADGVQSGKELVHMCFDRMFATRIEPALSAGAALGGEGMAPDGAIRTRAFTRYMMGQMHIFARYPWLPESHTYFQKLANALLQTLPGGISPQQCAAVRSLYEQYLSILVERGVISADDEHNFAEVCPLFDPFFVFYDEEKDTYRNLADLHNDILGDKSKAKTRDRS